MTQHISSPTHKIHPATQHLNAARADTLRFLNAIMTEPAKVDEDGSISVDYQTGKFIPPAEFMLLRGNIDRLMQDNNISGLYTVHHYLSPSGQWLLRAIFANKQAYQSFYDALEKALPQYNSGENTQLAPSIFKGNDTLYEEALLKALDLLMRLCKKPIPKTIKDADRDVYLPLGSMKNPPEMVDLITIDLLNEAFEECGLGIDAFTHEIPPEEDFLDRPTAFYVLLRDETQAEDNLKKILSLTSDCEHKLLAKLEDHRQKPRGEFTRPTNLSLLSQGRIDQGVNEVAQIVLRKFFDNAVHLNKGEIRELELMNSHEDWICVDVTDQPRELILRAGQILLESMMSIPSQKSFFKGNHLNYKMNENETDSKRYLAFEVDAGFGADAIEWLIDHQHQIIHELRAKAHAGRHSTSKTLH